MQLPNNILLSLLPRHTGEHKYASFEEVLDTLGEFNNIQFDSPEPLVKLLGIPKDFWKQKVEQRPQFMQIVLKWSPRNQ